MIFLQGSWNSHSPHPWPDLDWVHCEKHFPRGKREAYVKENLLKNVFNLVTAFGDIDHLHKRLEPRNSFVGNAKKDKTIEVWSEWT